MTPERARRLLYVVHYPVFSGPHNEALRLAAPLRERGWEVTVALPSEPGNGAERLRAGGLEVVTLPLHRLRARPSPTAQAPLLRHLVPDVRRLRALIRASDAELVAAVGLVNPHAAIAARLEGVPAVWKIVDTRVPGPLRGLLMPLVDRLAAAVMYTGEAVRDAHRVPGAGRAAAVVYYPPVDTELFRPSARQRSAGRASLGVPDGAPVVGAVANVAPQKGLEYLVRACARVFVEEPDTRFLIAGSVFDTHTAYAELVRAEIRRSGVPADRWLWTGYRSDPENVYPVLDVKALTPLPRSEGVTTTVLEAMACGVPVVTADVAGLAEVVEDGVTGAVVPPLDLTAAAEAILRLLRDPAGRTAMGEEARRRTVERYGARACADLHARTFELALRGSRTATASPSSSAVGMSRKRS